MKYKTNKVKQFADTVITPVLLVKSTEMEEIGNVNYPISSYYTASSYNNVL